MIEIPTTIDQGVATLIAAGIALSSAIIGFVASQIVEFFRISREAKIRQKEKVVDRMIAAHEAVISIADTMLAVVMLNDVDNLPEDTEKPVRGAGIVLSLDLYEEWMLQFKKVHSQHMWLSSKVLKELYFVQDYSVNLYNLMQTMNESELKTLSVIIKQDFIDLSSSLRNESVIFISTKAIKLDLDVNPKRWHKYKKEITLRRLQETKLMKNYGDRF